MAVRLAPINGLLLPEAALAALVDRVRDAAVAIDERLPCPGPVHLTLRARGRSLATVWQDDGELVGALAAALALGSRLGADLLQLDLCHRFRPVAPESFGSTLATVHRGIRGLQITLGPEIERYPPSRMIAQNLSFERALQLFLQRRSLDPDGFLRAGGRLHRFEARQLLVLPAAPARAISLFRGGRVVAPEEITAATLATMVEQMGGWMRAQVGADGRLPYKIWPSRSHNSTADNPIRQFMATLCLIRLAARSGTTADRDLAARNLAHNLERFFVRQGAIGVIAHEGSAKLGAAALAALAILEPPSAPRHAEVLEALDAGVLALWRDDGSFRSFHFPPERNDNQNFYPGEALLYWAARDARAPDPQRLGRCLRTFEHYRGWHRARRNPAFVPWHSQALRLLFERTGRAELRAFVFEMNDWLVGLQQWEQAPYPDLRGRFYDPAHPEYGPPHASSTGVYLEGLADALALAEATGDRPRADRYALAIRRGIRSLRQLQFKDTTDAFYVSRPERVLGGVRTEAYDNAIRIDNVQHGLMALMKLEAIPGFIASLGS